MFSRTLVCAAWAVSGVVAAACDSGGLPPPDGEDPIAWSVQGPASLGGIATDGVSFFVGTATHELLSITRATRQIAWRVALGPAGVRSYDANVLVVGSNVVVGDGDLYAIDRTSGQLIWHYTPTVGSSPGAFGIVTDGTTIYTGSLSGDVFAVDARQGVEKWRTRLSTLPQTSVVGPVLVGNVLVVGYKSFSANPQVGGVARLDAIDGTVVWQRALTPEQSNYPSGVVFSPGIEGDAVFTGSDDGRILCLALADGATRWAAPRLTELQSLGDHRPILVQNGFVYAGSTTGVVTAYAVADGAQRWRHQIDRGSIEVPLVADGRNLYLVDLGQALTALDLQNGTARWTIGRGTGAANGLFYPYPFVVGDTVVVPGERAVYGVVTK